MLRKETFKTIINMKNKYIKILRIATAPIVALVLFVVLLLPANSLKAATITSTATGGSWQLTTTWVGGVVPSATDSVIIAAGATVTVDAPTTCVYLSYLTAASKNTIVIINGNYSLTINGLLNMVRPSTTAFYCSMRVNAGSLSCNLLTMNATSSGRNDTLSVSTGVANILGTVTIGTTGTGCIFNIVATGTINFGGTISGTPVLTTATGSTVNYTSALAQTVINARYNGNLGISGGGAKTLNAKDTLYGTLFLTSGNLITTTTNFLYITNTASTAISGGSATSFIDGPLKWKLPPSLATGSNYIFPVGKGTTFLPFTLNNPTTDTGTVTAQVEAFAVSAGGTFDASITSLSTTEYWSLTTSGNFTNSSVSLVRPTAIAPFNSVGGSVALTGPYSYLAGVAGTNGVSVSNPIGTKRFFLLANGGCVNPPPDPANPSSNSPQCISPGVTLTRTGTPPAGETWFWQTSATGTSTANSGSTYNVTTSGTYYIRSQNNSTLCWSSGAGSLAVVVIGLPTVANPSSGSITPVSAALGGDITDLGCTNITSRGIYYSTTSGFTIGSAISAYETPGPYPLGTFSEIVSGLTPGTTYYYKAFATNSYGSFYTSEASFTTGVTAFSSTAISTFGTSVCVNTTVGPHSFTLSGTFLTTDSIIINPLSCFTYSTTSGGTYTSSLTLPCAGGSFSQLIYVKFTPTAGQSYNGNIVVSGGGAPNHNVPVTGSGFVSVQILNSTPTVSGVTGNGAVLGGSITNSGCSSAIERGIYYSTVNGFTPPGQGTKVSETPGPYSVGAFTENVTGLTSVTTYYFRSFATNNEGTTFSQSQGTFTTSCGTVLSYPWTENFDALPSIGTSNGTSNIPSCWKVESGSGTPWASMTSSPYNSPASYPNYITCYYSPVSTDKYIITPGFTLTVGNSYDFSFKYAGSGYAGWNADVRYNTSQTGAGSTIIGTEFLSTGTVAATTYTTYTSTFIPPSSGTYYFMVHVNSTGTPQYLGFDDFKVTATSTLPPTITSLGSTQSCPSGSLTINGTNFYGVTASNITIGGTPISSITSNTGTSMVVVLGAGSTGYVSVNNGYGTATDSIHSFTFTPAPTLSGINNCLYVGSTITLNAYPSGGTWYSNTLSVATVNVNTGVVSGVTTGTSTITYNHPAGCTAATTITVTPLIAATFTPTTQTLCSGIQPNPISISGSNIGTTTLINWTTSTPAPNTFTAGSGVGVGGVNVPYYSGNVLHLTDWNTTGTNTPGETGAFYIQNPSHFNSSAFTATFDMRMYNDLRTSGWFADGISFNYGNNMPNPPSGAMEDGQGTGLCIGMHEYGYTGGPYIFATYNGVNLSGNVSTTLHTSAYQTCIVDVSSSNQLTVKINGTTLINVAMPAAYIAANKSTWYFNFAARNGWYTDTDGHWLKNISITFPQQYEYSFNGGVSYQSSNTYTPPIGANGLYNVVIRQVGSTCPTNLGNDTIISVSPPAPSGNASQLFTYVATVADLVANGSTIHWYAASTGGSALSTTTTLVNGTTYYASQTVGGCESQTRFAVTVNINLIKTVTLHLMLQGLYDLGSGAMLEANDIDWGTGNVFPKYGTDIADEIQVQLFEGSPPFTTPLVNVSGIYLHKNGLASFQISPSHSGDYYIKVLSRNHLETWSAAPVSFAATSVEYYFMNNLLSAYQAPGGMDPQIQVSLGVYAFYLGDLDHSLGVDFDDFNVFEPYLTDGTFGFTIADFNGSGLVDFDDFNLFEPNLNLGPFAQYPGMVKK